MIKKTKDNTVDCIIRGIYICWHTTLFWNVPALWSWEPMNCLPLRKCNYANSVYWSPCWDKWWLFVACVTSIIGAFYATIFIYSMVWILNYACWFVVVCHIESCFSGNIWLVYPYNSCLYTWENHIQEKLDDKITFCNKGYHLFKGQCSWYISGSASWGFIICLWLRGWPSVWADVIPSLTHGAAGW